MLPTVSPGKTWVGLLGGIVTTTILATVFAPMLTPFEFYHSIMSGLIISIGGFMGDVTMSAVKRDLGKKGKYHDIFRGFSLLILPCCNRHVTTKLILFVDSGTLLPGHGGILDRVDSLTYTAPLFFHFVHDLYRPR